jgi:hypothetical protein
LESLRTPKAVYQLHDVGKPVRSVCIWQDRPGVWFWDAADAGTSGTPEPMGPHASRDEAEEAAGDYYSPRALVSVLDAFPEGYPENWFDLTTSPATPVPA